MTIHDIVVIGASAGGVEALIKLCSALPRDLSAAVFVVQHTSPDAPRLLTMVIQRRTQLMVQYPEEGETIEYGKIYIAPPNRHMLLRGDKIYLSSGPRENFSRPSVDTLFRSAALAFGPRVVGIVLSGTRYDGTAGMQAIHERGGVTIVQDPQEALFPGMPISALENLDVDYTLKLNGIASAIVKLSRAGTEDHVVSSADARSGSNPGIDESDPPDPEDDCEAEEGMVNTSQPDEPKEESVMRQDKNGFDHGDETSPRTVFTCPECGGVLWEVQDGKLLNYICHVGHKFSTSSLFQGQSEAIEKALWVAVRTLEEKSSLSSRLASRALEAGHNLVHKQFTEQAEEAKLNADVIRKVILSGGGIDPGTDFDEIEARST